MSGEDSHLEEEYEDRYVMDGEEDWLGDDEDEEDGEELMCDECPDFDIMEPTPCRFWLKGQPCPGPEGVRS